jgi:hypothetical protein
MDSVFGLTVQQTRGDFVLVEGNTPSRTAGGAGLSVHRGFGESAADAVTQITETLARAPRNSPRVGHRRVLGLTCSNGGGAHAPLLRDRLADHNFDVVAVQFAAASKALARYLARQRAAVCVIEPDGVIALMAGRDGTLASAHSRPEDSEELSRWLTAVFGRYNWRPDSVVVVGQGSVDAITSRLTESLEVRVWTPARAQAALALGAALCAAHRRPVIDTPLVDSRDNTDTSEPEQTQQRRSGRTAGFIGMTAGLGVGAAALAMAVIMRPTDPPKTVQPEDLKPPATTAAPTSLAPATPPASLPSMAPLTAPTESPPPVPPPAVDGTPSQSTTQPDSSPRRAPPPSPASPPADQQLPISPQAPQATQDEPPSDCTLLCGITI